MAVTLNGSRANYMGLSTDTKPADADNNSIYLELDTGDFYYFSEADNDWHKVGG